MGLRHVSELAAFADAEIEPQEKPAPAPPCTVVIFGAGGDLTARLLMPALYNLSVSELLDARFAVIGVDRLDLDDDALRTRYREHLEHFVAERRGAGGGVALDREKWDWLEQRISYVRGDFDDPATYAELGSRVAGLNATFYLAVAARFFGPIVDQIGRAGLASEEEGHFRRVVVEKPFGSDLVSARALNKRLLTTLEESADLPDRPLSR